MGHDIMLDKPVADLMWVIRLLRAENGAPITETMVYERQQPIYGYSRLEVARIIEEIEDRGFRWKQQYPGVPACCILVGDEQVHIAQEWTQRQR